MTQTTLLPLPKRKMGRQEAQESALREQYFEQIRPLVLERLRRRVRRNSTDLTRVRYAFETLRDLGFVAEQSWECCQGCGWAAIDPSHPDVIFYHQQDASRFSRGHLDGSFYIAHRGKAAWACEALLASGLAVEWDGDPTVRIKVSPLEISGRDRAQR